MNEENAVSIFQLENLRILSLYYLAQAAILTSKTHKFRALSLPASY